MVTTRMSWTIPIAARILRLIKMKRALSIEICDLINVALNSASAPVVQYSAVLSQARKDSIIKDSGQPL
jgi:hypothetical protein